RRFLQSGPRDLTSAKACEAAAARFRDLFAGVRDGVDRFLDDGPTNRPQFAMLADDIRRLVSEHGRPLQSREEQAAFRALVDRLRGYFLTQEGKPRGDKFMGTGFT